MRNYLAYYVLTILLLCCSCSPKMYYQEGYIDSDIPAVQNASNSDIYFETRFAGDAIDYLIFELDIENSSDQDLPLSVLDISLVLQDYDNNETMEIYPFDKNTLIKELEERRRILKSEKRTRNIAGIVGVGLSVFAVGASGNTYDALNAAAIATDITAEIIYDNRSYALMDGDIETQTQYVDEWVLDDVLIPSDMTTSYDLIFPSTLINGKAILNIQNDDIRYKQEYVFEIVELKQ